VINNSSKNYLNKSHKNKIYNGESSQGIALDYIKENLRSETLDWVFRKISILVNQTG